MQSFCKIILNGILLMVFQATSIAEEATVPCWSSTLLLAHTKELSKKCGKCEQLEINWFKVIHFCVNYLFCFFLLFVFWMFIWWIELLWHNKRWHGLVSGWRCKELNIIDNSFKRRIHFFDRLTYIFLKTKLLLLLY